MSLPWPDHVVPLRFKGFSPNGALLFAMAQKPSKGCKERRSRQRALRFTSMPEGCLESFWSQQRPGRLAFDDLQRTRACAFDRIIELALVGSLRRTGCCLERLCLDAVDLGLCHCVLGVHFLTPEHVRQLHRVGIENAVVPACSYDALKGSA